MRVLAFDIGIKNLAFCVLDKTTESPTILQLENCNIVESKQPEPVKCHYKDCDFNASYQADNFICCKKHIPNTHQILDVLNKKKLPTNRILKELIKEHGCEQLGHSHKKYLESVMKRFTIHFAQPKQENTGKMSLETIHDALRVFTETHWEQFTECTHVLLENQPVYKNPHMKSVQILLFATLRETFLKHEEYPEYHFIHAGKKIKDAEKGDDGYKERKMKSEERLKVFFDECKDEDSPIHQKWTASKKKSDMSDAFCMAHDFNV
jgi:hypothetical protein